MSIHAKLSESGETKIDILFSRSHAGLTIHVSARPEVEEFVQQLGAGETVDVRTVGRHWTPAGKDANPLLVYALTAETGILHNGMCLYRLDQPGWPIILSGEGVAPVVNLSFLRLVGISGPNGVSFNLRGVYTLETLRATSDRVMQAAGQFYASYLKSAWLSAQVVAQESGVPCTTGQEPF